MLHLNGRETACEAAPDRPLLGVLREALQLTGTKYGCGEGQCGACTVLLDGRAVRSCTLTVGEVAGRTLTTIEGLASAEALHPVQQAFLDTEALQCGYCTAGMILATVALLQEHPQPTEAQILEALDSHLCRCGTYHRILRAVRRAAELLGAAR
ncbi:MAG: (2Fe-2S)-binding protein [Fimbriimonadaceae bacterium]|nr:(2Fe-2S)-binding protein [Fimbriimonadaceae bacterium]